MPQRIQHVSIPFHASEQPAARHFYVELVGLQEVPVPPTLNAARLLWFRLGDTELHLFHEAPPLGKPAQHLCIAYDDRAELEALRARLIDGGIQVDEVVAIPGRPRFVCRDPFQNLLEFTTIEYNYLQDQPPR
jgi:catechol 2,3-dioxygenase-like lactoylglutathione lyase family enzyme